MIAASALASWNVPFQNIHASRLWRAISVASVALPVICLVFTGLAGAIDNAKYEATATRTMVFSLFVHALARAILIILLFYSFTALPSGVYTTLDWLDFLPFIH